MRRPGSFFDSFVRSLDRHVLDPARALAGAGEIGLMIGTGAAADAVGGVNASLAALAGDQDPRRFVDQARETFTYQPRTDAARDAMGVAGRGIQATGEALQQAPGAVSAQQGWYDFTAHAPMLAAVGVGAINTFGPGRFKPRGGRIRPGDFVEVDADAFRANMAGARTTMKELDSLQVSDLPEGFQGRAFLTPDGKSGFAIAEDGELISLFKAGSADFKGTMDAALTRGRAEGARHLHAFDLKGKLVEGYGKRGAKETDRYPFDEEQMVPGWRPDEHGRPDYVRMDLNPEPAKTRKGYKLFRVDENQPGKLFPLYVERDRAIPVGEWQRANVGPANAKGSHVKASIGELAMRPGFHAGTLPQARHIGAKIDPVTGQRTNRKGIDPTHREPWQVWAEVEFADDYDWQTVANSRSVPLKSGPNKGQLDPRKAHITDQVPYAGNYSYKTNSNAEGDWLIGGDMRVNRVLTDDEVAAINAAAGRADLPRQQPFDLARYGFARPEATPVREAARMPLDDQSLADLEGLSNKQVRDMTKAEPDIGRSVIGAAQGWKDGKSPPPTAEGVTKALEARARYRKEKDTTPGADADDAEWAGFGAAHGVNLTVTPPVEVAPGVSIPGGLDGKFTIADLFEMKAANISPQNLPRDVHDALMQKMVRTYNIENPDPVDVYNRLLFAILSPNAPLLSNEFLAARFRATSIEDIRKMAARKGEKGLAARLDEESGVGAANRGGLGAKGTADLSQLADLAEAVLKKPELFKAGPGETLLDVAMRVMNQIPGLGPKTASLGVPWLDLPNSNVSAVDLHMIKNNYDRMLTDKEVGPEFVKRMAELMGTKPTVAAVRKAAAKDPKKAVDNAIKIVGGTTRSAVYRDAATGELGPEIPPSIAPGKMLTEPKQAQFFNEFYTKIMDYVNESRGENPAIALFPEQWRLWDGYRERFEPHEFAHPDFRRLPRQSFNEMHRAFFANKDAGFARGKPGFKPKPHGKNWRDLYYGRANPLLLAGVAGAGAGGLSLLAQFGGDSEEKETKRRNRSADVLEELGE